MNNTDEELDSQKQWELKMLKWRVIGYLIINDFPVTEEIVDCLLTDNYYFIPPPPKNNFELPW